VVDSLDADDSSSASRSGSARERVYQVSHVRQGIAEESYWVKLKKEISNHFKYLLDKKDETVYQLKGSGNDPIINSGATSTCSRQIKLFKSLD
jgi:hypothetical protein